MFRAVRSVFVALPDGSERFLAAGALVPAGDPVLVGRAHLFTEAPEAASAAPVARGKASSRKG